MSRLNAAQAEIYPSPAITMALGGILHESICGNSPRYAQDLFNVFRDNSCEIIRLYPEENAKAVSKSIGGSGYIATATGTDFIHINVMHRSFVLLRVCAYHPLENNCGKSFTLA